MVKIRKPLVRSMYDMQHQRIQTGNRICAEIKARLGQGPGMSEEELDKQAQDYLEVARLEYRRITDAFVLNQAHKYLKVDFGPYEVISDVGMLIFVELYVEQLSHEEKMGAVIGKIVQQHPLWDAFFKGVKGCGPLMSAIILAEFDIHKAKRVSSFWKYSGLDVVTWKQVTKEQYEETPQEDRQWFSEPPMDENGNPVFWVKDGRGRGRYREHLVKYSYTDKDGKSAVRDGLSFNPFLKTKLVGVLASCFLKQSPDKCKYRRVYDEYKHRMENHAKYGTQNDARRTAEAKKAGRKYSPKAHRHNMAMRYMTKIFLQDLWVAWRTVEGLPVTPTYAEAKLGYVHHGEPKVDADAA
jgi:hypothetical protein